MARPEIRTEDSLPRPEVIYGVRGQNGHRRNQEDRIQSRIRRRSVQDSGRRQAIGDFDQESPDQFLGAKGLLAPQKRSGDEAGCGAGAAVTPEPNRRMLFR